MRGRHGRRAAVLALAMVAALGAGASCARAASVSLTPGFPATVWFSGEVDADTVTIRVDPGAVTVSDSTATLTAASGCDQVDAHSATCTVPDGMLAGVYGTLGPGSDAASVTGAIHVQLQGGGGDDTLSAVGSTGIVELRGESGDDQLSISGPRGGALWGGGGNDVLVAAGGPAWLSGEDGNDRLTGGDQADTLLGGPGRDQLAGGGGDDRLYDGSGADVVSGGAGDDTYGVDPTTGPVDVSLDGVANDGAPGEGDDVEADVENVDAPAAALAHLVGDGEANRLTCGAGCTVGGGAGDDTLAAGPGSAIDGGEGDDDVLLNVDDPPYGGKTDVHGGPGVDSVELLDGYRGTVAVSLDDAANDGPEGARDDDVHSDVENVVGGAEVDLLVGTDGPNRLEAGAGDDVLDGGGGADVLLGGDGQDEVSYASRASGVRVTLDDVADDGAPGEGDDVASDVEQVDGGNGNDDLRAGSTAVALVGGGGDDSLTGGPGDDVLVGGYGTDTLRGGDGEDLVAYADHAAPVDVTLDGQANDGSAQENDLVASDIEDVYGSPFADRLVGDAAGNALWGDDGGDVLVGGAGLDFLSGQGGDDLLEARDGAFDELDCGIDDGDVATVDYVDLVFECATVVGPESDPAPQAPPSPAPLPPRTPRVPPPVPPVPPVPEPPIATLPAPAVPAVRLSGIALARRATLVVTIACPRTRWGACRGSLNAASTAPRIPILGHATFAVPAGKTRTLRLPLRTSTRHALAHRTVVHAVLRATVRAGSRSRTVVRRVTLHLS